MALFHGTNWGDVIEGSDLADLILGHGGHDVINGGLGADVILGGIGNDTIRGERGDDTISGGDGDDELRGGRGNDSVSGDDGDDLIYGGDGNDIVDGGAGHDWLWAGRGDDWMFGGDGNDWFFGSAGADYMSGGDGFDLVDYSASASRVRVYLDTGKGYSGDAEGDQYHGIEAIIGSAWNDSLTGNNDANAIWGGDGRDYIDGGSGADALSGGFGNDTLFGGGHDDVLFGDAGADRLVGESGYDTVNYSASGSAVHANLTTGLGQYGDAEGDRYETVENLIGSDFGDVLTGNAMRNRLEGGQGNDWLIAGAANHEHEGGDIFIGGDGADRMFGNGDAEWFFVKGSDIVSGGGGGDVLDFTLSGGHGWTIDLEEGTATQSYLTDGSAFLQHEISFSAMAHIRATEDNDFVTGDADETRIDGFGGSDYLSAGAGDDTIDPGTGANDIVLGGAGDDLILITNRDTTGPSQTEGGFAQLLGGSGADTFGFTFDHQAPQFDRAHILDFDRTEGDRIAFRSADMVFIGEDDFVGGGAVETRIEVLNASASHFRVEMDRSGNGAADFSFEVSVEDGLGVLTASDFDFIFS